MPAKIDDQVFASAIIYIFVRRLVAISCRRFLHILIYEFPEIYSSRLETTCNNVCADSGVRWRGTTGIVGINVRDSSPNLILEILLNSLLKVSELDLGNGRIGVCCGMRVLGRHVVRLPIAANQNAKTQR